MVAYVVGKTRGDIAVWDRDREEQNLRGANTRLAAIRDVVGDTAGKQALSRAAATNWLTVGRFEAAANEFALSCTSPRTDLITGACYATCGKGEMFAHSLSPIQSFALGHKPVEISTADIDAEADSQKPREELVALSLLRLSSRLREIGSPKKADDLLQRVVVRYDSTGTSVSKQQIVPLVLGFCALGESRTISHSTEAARDSYDKALALVNEKTRR